jgi:hypothetical protein
VTHRKIPPIRVSVVFASRADPVATAHVLTILRVTLQRHPMPRDYNPNQHIPPRGGERS